MQYLVRAKLAKPGSGTFVTDAETIPAAFRQAHRLRAHGLIVEVTDPKGQTVDEPKESNWTNEAQTAVFT
jgi:hypothetical protein